MKTFNDWFLSLVEGRQKSLREDKWKMAEAAFDEARKIERKRIADAMYEFQKTVTMFATTNECVAYNKALRDFADQIDGV